MAIVIRGIDPAVAADGTRAVNISIDGSGGWMVRGLVPSALANGAIEAWMNDVANLPATLVAEWKDTVNGTRAHSARDASDAPVPEHWRHTAFSEDDLTPIMRALAKEIFDELRALGSARNNASFLAGILTRLS